MNLPMPELEKIMANSSSINLISLDKKKWKNSEGNKSMTEMDIVADKRFTSPSHRMSKNVLYDVLFDEFPAGPVSISRRPR